jgi:hypothetical protein
MPLIFHESDVVVNILSKLKMWYLKLFQNFLYKRIIQVNIEELAGL